MWLIVATVCAVELAAAPGCLLAERRRPGGGAERGAGAVR